ncbi:MAG: nucleotidyltransferase family protein [Pseudomonadota bacterium]|nr:nucleotidyltransferase family protein [Pseudomonadota bacterium]
MKAMILAAGRGERLRPLTDSVPKPLLPVAGRPVIEYTIAALVDAGFIDSVINVAYLGQVIEQALGNGDRFGADLSYSREGKTGLETAGGVVHALPLLGDGPFLVVNGDILTDFPFDCLRTRRSRPAHLVLVKNPPHHPSGDFYLDVDRLVSTGEETLTFSGIGVYTADFFSACRPGKLPLGPLLREAVKLDRVSAEMHQGFWMDLGTLGRLKLAEEQVSKAVFGKVGSV